MLKEMVRHAGNSGTREVVLGMAHRGRLNVLINVLGKKPQDLFDEFAGKHKEHLGTGDVKYHMGFSSDIETEGGLVHLALAFYPSHLEIVSPVVMGSVRAPSGQTGRTEQQQSVADHYSRRRRGDRPGRGSGNPEHVESARLRSGRYGTYRYPTTRWASPPLTHWMRVQRLTAPISVKWSRRRFSTSMRMIRKPSLL
ncbi:2-oxoglutarate dehydrogenase E1 component [Salmonella enterica subsp. enterica]|uniref:oxoglutarate dehydrogenase (succinyl-transferring) n=1 Tax=Salmonella enterica I TaxID=59201 RepID=A0A379WCI7_SALET|nr:2-oxoglutarate dehydrogenase E1 component [Salmonella enterica subsp. enterica]